MISCFKRVKSVVAKAADPDEVATAAIPPSKDANLCSRISAVGLFILVYI